MPDAIFIDTSVYRSHQFHFENPRFRSLATLAEHGRITILTTDVTVREIHSNLDELFDEALAPLNKALASKGILRRATSFTLSAIEAPLKEEAARKELHDEVDAFFRQSGFTTLSTASLMAGPILDRYFRGQPPFGSGKKKSEFPDAFAAATIVDWATSKSRSITVVAEDADWESLCETEGLLSYRKGLTVVVEDLLKQEENAGVVKAHLLASRFSSQIASAVADQLVNEWAYLEDVDGEVISIQPGAAQIVSTRVVGVADALATIAVEVSCEATFEVSYDDPTSWIYDSEEKVAHYMNRIETTLDRELLLEAEVVLALSGHEDEPPILESVTLSGDRRLGLNVEDFEGYDEYR